MLCRSLRHPVPISTITHQSSPQSSSVLRTVNIECAAPAKKRKKVTKKKTGAARKGKKVAKRNIKKRKDERKKKKNIKRPKRTIKKKSPTKFTPDIFQ